MSSFSVLKVKFLLTFDDVDGFATLFTFLPAAIGVGRLTSCVVVVTVHGGVFITSLYLEGLLALLNEARDLMFVKHSIETK